MLHFQHPPSSLSPESQVNEPPWGSPMGPLWRELPVSRAFFYMFLWFPNKKFSWYNLTFCSKSLVKKCPLHVPQTGPQWKKTSVPRALLDSVSFWVPTKGALPPDSPHRAPTERERERARDSVSRAIYLSLKIPGKWSPSRFPTGAPMKRDARFQSLPLHILQGPQ
jgi:hypothetical protein